uniref:Uncharacterized protein LOC104236984 n=1 Tax=Nicotiana sylvestris TaxID=4096 RepID=A0A1U7XB72_NICSY|nr:PREDICTED: uncharacterized protein LOC104236984 [Nicotiana sylvestris]
MVTAPGASPPTQPARGRGQAARGGGQAIRARPKDDSSDVVITSTVYVCSRDASVQFDPGSTYSYVSSCFTSYLVVPRDSSSALMYVSTLVGDAIVVDHVYRSCVVIIRSLEASMDLLLLDL